MTAALVAIFGKLGLSKIDSTLATTIRALFMAVFLVVVSLVLKKFNGFQLRDLDSKHWWYIILAGVAGALSWLFYFAALKTGQATSVVAIDRLSVVFVFIFAVLLLGEPFKVKTAVGALIMVAGVLLMVR